MRRGLTLAAAALLLAGCGGSDDDDGKLDRQDARLLQSARERLDDAIDTTEILRTDRAEARRLRSRARRSTLPEEVPSLVDSDARREFLRYAVREPRRALHLPASEAVATIVATVDGKDRDERIRTLDRQTLRSYLREAERDVRPLWPDLAKQLSSAG